MNKANSSVFKKNFSSGFTLVELLVVIGVLGVLSAAVLTAINPLEQFARGRDGNKKTVVNQLGHALQAYYSAQSVYPAEGATWMDTLQTAQEIKVVPPAATPSCGNAAAPQDNGYCYDNTGTDATVYIAAESQAERTRIACAAANTVWIVWTSVAGKTGLACLAAGTYPTTATVPQ
jgi:prepilin-type N-terminal cleavage/methylation domain-containing protein